MPSDRDNRIVAGGTDQNPPPGEYPAPPAAGDTTPSASISESGNFIAQQPESQPKPFLKKLSEATSVIIVSVILGGISALFTLEFKRAGERGRYEIWKNHADQKHADYDALIKLRIEELKHMHEEIHVMQHDHEKAYAEFKEHILRANKEHERLDGASKERAIDRFTGSDWQKEKQIISLEQKAFATELERQMKMIKELERKMGVE